MGNNTVSKVKGIGKLKIVNPDQSTVVLTEVRYMPSMVRNLISFDNLKRMDVSILEKITKLCSLKEGRRFFRKITKMVFTILMALWRKQK